MNRKLKTLLKVGVIAVVPGALVYFLAKRFIEDLNDRAEFRAYIRKNYGEGSAYVDRYSTDYVDRH